MSQRHGIGDADLFLNHFVASLYDKHIKHLTSGFHLKFENISVWKLKSKKYNQLKIEWLHMRNPLSSNWRPTSAYIAWISVNTSIFHFQEIIWKVWPTNPDHFSNFWKIKWRETFFFLQILRFHTIVCCFVLLFLETDGK